MRWRWALVAALSVLPLLLILGSGFFYDPRSLPNVVEGREIAPFQLRSLDEQWIDTANWPEQPIFINFWATWCVPCRIEHEVLQAAARRYANRVHFVGILYEEKDIGAARAFLQHYPSAYGHLQDPNAEIAMEFGVAGVPESFLLSANRRVLHKFVGPVQAEALEQWLQAALAAEQTAAAERSHP